MQSIQAIKARIGSISSTRQITQSMRLVSTAKVQRCRARMLANRPFLEEMERFVASVSHSLDYPNSYLEARPVRATALVVINGDRGLCGGYNISVTRKAVSLLEEATAPVKLVTVGAKARESMRRRREFPIAKSFTGISESPLFEDAAQVADLLLDWYNQGEVDRVDVISTQFVSMLVQHPRVETLLPLTPRKGGDTPAGWVHCEPGGDALLGKVVPFYAAAYLYGALLEAAACEQAARITSMDSAVRTSDEMMQALQLSYNQARQGAITQEIIEIVGGADAAASGEG